MKHILRKLNSIIKKAREWYLNRSVFKPGTPVTPLCSCHRGQTWYVEMHISHGNDYIIVPTWPAPQKQYSKSEVDYLFIARENVALLKKS
jgi:hypothetical protein